MALSAALFVWICARLMGRRLAFNWYLIAFAGCWWVYLVDAGLFSPAEEDNLNLPQRVHFYQSHRRPLAIAAILFTAVALAVTFITVRLNPGEIALLCVLGLCGGAYVFPVIGGFGGGSRKRLKDFAFWKPVVISLVWLAGGMLLPLVAGSVVSAPSASTIALAVLLFLLLMGDSIALDWRDRLGDEQLGINTFAVMLGPWVLVIIALELIAATAVWWMARGDQRWNHAGAAMIATHALGFLFLPLARKKPLLFYLAIAAWRFAGALALLM